MATGLNKAQLIGYLGRDAELRYAGQDAVVTLSLATTEGWKDKQTGEWKERAEWHRVVIWGKLAESLSEYLVKGKQIYVEGRIQTRKWFDKKTNADRYTTEIRADKVMLLSSKNGSGKPAEGPATATSEGPADEQQHDDDIPF